MGVAALLGPQLVRVQSLEQGITGQLAPSLLLDWWIDAESFDVAEVQGKWV